MALHDDGPLARLLPDGNRLHLQHGPIDLIIGADGSADEVDRAYRQATAYFQDVLVTLASELHLLRRPTTSDAPAATGEIARHMQAHAQAHAADTFVTPMIAVAGAVADFVLDALLCGRTLRRAYVNNGGDIALMLAKGATFDIAVCSNPDTGRVPAKVRLVDDDGVGGIATSGWRGRSHSLGIADAVTVLASNAAAADVAATLIANAVDVSGSPRIKRAPACHLAPDSDLGDRLVTIDVEELPSGELDAALDRGRRVAKRMIWKRQIIAAYLSLQGRSATCERPSTFRRRTGSAGLERTSMSW
ncbi:MAG: UPF0280 family protein [Hyphomicrobiaceae bacterium]